MRYFVLVSLFVFLIIPGFAQTIVIGGSAGGAVVACVGAPGNTAGAYRSLCQTSGGALYSCNNSGGCTVAADWVSQGGSASALGFDAVTTGSNTTATMTVGNGATLTYTGTGIINASKILGTTITGLTGIAKLTAGVPSVAVAGDFPTLNQSTTGNAATATALAANGANCSAGQFPLGVDAAGAAESCTALPTTIAGTSNQITASGSTGAITLSLPSGLILPGTVNKLTLTQPATGSTLTIADGKTATFSNSITFAGTDLTTMTFPSTSSALAPLASPTFTGTVTMPAPTLNNVTGSTQCLHVNTSGVVSGTGSDCGAGGAGGGDASTNTSTSVDSEIALFSGTGGKTLKRATGTGIAKVTSGVLGTAVAGDFPTLNQNTSGTAANLSGTPALPNGTTATTQSQADNSTKLATTAYADTLGRYTPTGTGAVSTALGSFDKNCPTPEAYGAVGDGTTDDATALQNLITNNNCINLPFGKTYKFNTGLTISNKTGFELRGHGSSEGNGGSKLLYGGTSGTTALTFSANRGPGCYIHDFQLDANNLAGISINVVATSGTPAHACEFRNIQVFNTTGTPGVCVQLGDTNDYDVGQNIFYKVNCTTSKIAYRQQGTQTVTNKILYPTVLGFSDRGLVFEKGDAWVEGATIDGDASIYTSGTADIEVQNSVIYANLIRNYHEIYRRPNSGGSPCAKRTAPIAMSFPSGSRSSTTNIDNVRVLWGLDSGNPISYNQKGDLNIIAPMIDAGLNPAGCSAMTVAGTITLANGNTGGVTSGLFVSPGRIDSAVTYSISGPWIQLRAPLSSESTWKFTAFDATGNSSIIGGGLTITKTAGSPAVNEYLDITGDYTSNVSTALPGVRFKGGSMYPSTASSWPSIQVGNNGYSMVFRGGASVAAPNAAGMSFDTASGILFTWGATEFARADTNGYWHMKFPTSCTGLSSGMAYNNGTAIVPCP